MTKGSASKRKEGTLPSGATPGGKRSGGSSPTSNSSSGLGKSTGSTASSSESSNGKKAPPKQRRRESVWGDQRSKKNRALFRSYLKRLKSAEKYLSPDGVRFVTGLSARMRKMFYSRLDEVDPEGRKRLVLYIQKVRLRKTLDKKKLLTPRERNRDMFAVVSKKFDMDNVEAVHFIRMEGMTNLVATLFAAGYSMKKMEMITGLTSSQMRDMVTQEDVRRMSARTSEFIVKAADRRVLRDILAGELSKETEMVDKIAARRRGVELEAFKIAKTSSSELSAAEREVIEKRQENLFGIRKPGDVIDAEVVAEGLRDEDNDAGQTDQSG